MRYHRPPELWLEVKDNDYYERRLRELSCFAPRVWTGGMDKILKELYVVPIIEQLNKPLSWTGMEPEAPPPEPKRSLWARLRGWLR